MRINSFFYTIGQGFKNLGRNKWYTLASIATIGACLFLFGLVFSIINNIQYFVHTAEEGVSVTVFFNEGVNEDQILAVKSDLEKRPEVREINYIDPEAAWEDF
ncbi:MAG: permease-like cell division protein FtsX, partial [Butyrivibrio sp.]|nr:permease-like cell division protein FtsX [Butyrivibrio sp.]